MTGRRILAVAIITALASSTTRAGVIHVDDDAPADPGPGDKSVSDPFEDGSPAHPYDAIQEAIASAADGDEIIVAPGTYVENLDFLGKAITVESAAGPEQTIIDGGAAGPGQSPVVVSFVQDEDQASVLHGFTVTGASNNSGFGGIRCVDSSPTISNCIIRGNTAEGGGGIGISRGKPVIHNCLIAGNAAFGGAGVHCSGLGANAVLTNCTIVNNATLPGGTDNGGGVKSNFNAKVTIRNCIVWGNSAAEGSQLVVRLGASLNVAYCDVEGGLGDVFVDGGVLTWADGNTDADPLFGNPAAGDFRLSPGSPCIDAGQNNAIAAIAESDLDGHPRFADDPATADTGCGVPVVVDVGSYEFQGKPATVHFGDVNGDAKVGVRDLVALSQCLGSDGPACCAADLDLDGQVGESDFTLLLLMLVDFVPLK